MEGSVHTGLRLYEQEYADMDKCVRTFEAKRGDVKMSEKTFAKNENIKSEILDAN